MAIKRKTTEKEQSGLPASFLDQVRRAFSFQQISGKYEDAYKEEKAGILSYLETNKDGVEITSGKSLKTEYGSIVLKSTNYQTVDSEKIEAMIKAGEVSLTTILQISKIDAKKLATVVSAAKLAELVTVSTTESLAMTATPEFKAEIDAAFSLETKSPATPVAAPVVAAAVPKKSSLERAKAAAKSVDSDLDSILKGG